MWCMIFTNALTDRWTIDPHVYWLFYSSSKVLVLPLHYTEVPNCAVVTCDVAVVINWGEGLNAFLAVLKKFLLSHQYTPYISPFHTCIYRSPHFPEWWNLCLWEPPEGFWLFPSFEVHSYPVFCIYFKTLIQAFDVWYCYMWLSFICGLYGIILIVLLWWDSLDLMCTWSSFSSCLRPIWDICMWIALLVVVVCCSYKAVGWNKEPWPCSWEYWPHCILLKCPL